MLRILVVGFLSIFLLSCSNNVNVHIQNQENSNLNNRNDDVPITLIIFQLKDIKKFQSSNDNDIISNEDGVLGNDKIDSMRIQIAPKNYILPLKVDNENIPYIGILALFANDSEQRTTKVFADTKVGGMFSDGDLFFEISNLGIKQVKELTKKIHIDDKQTKNFDNQNNKQQNNKQKNNQQQHNLHNNELNINKIKDTRVY